MDFKNGFEGERDEERERREREEIWVGILTLVAGGLTESENLVGGATKYDGRIDEREKEIEATGGDRTGEDEARTNCWSSPGHWVSWVWFLASIEGFLSTTR